MNETKGRVIALDCLRAVAVLLVMARHLPDVPESTHVVIRLGVTALQRCGWIGVDLFFVLSGFLVSGLIFREYQRHNDLHIGRFLARRGFKIYPAFYAMLIVTILVNAATHWRTASVSNYLAELLFLQSYWRGAWDHTWTLAIEEHFYLLIAATVAWLSYRGRGESNPFRIIPTLFLVIAGLALFGRCVTTMLVDYSHPTHLFPTHLRIDSLMFGVVLSYFYCFDSARMKRVVQEYRTPLLIVALLMLSPVLFIKLGSNRWLATFGLSQLYIAFGVIVVGTFDWTPRVPAVIARCGAALASIGFYSYSIYLWHLPVLKYGQPLAEDILGRPLGYWTLVVLYVMGSIGVGVIMAKLIEIPALRFRNRYFPSRSAQDTQRPVEQLRRLAG